MLLGHEMRDIGLACCRHIADGLPATTPHASHLQWQMLAHHQAKKICSIYGTYIMTAYISRLAPRDAKAQ